MRQQHKAKAAELRQCEHCSKTLERRRDANGRLEGFRDFTRRRFCSLSCANSRPKGGESRKASHYHARKQRAGSCEACGTSKRLQVHHIDEDWKNNDPTNLQTLCVFCHAFWHAMHVRLGTKPTQRMPRLASPLAATPEPEWDACAPTETRLTRSKRGSSSKQQYRA